MRPGRLTHFRGVSEEPDECCAACTALGRAARVVADSMGLRDWVIEVAHDPPEDAGVELVVDLPAEQRRMRLRASERFWFLDYDRRAHAIAHECGHALHRDLWETVRGGVSQELGGAALRIYLSQVSTEIERVVDAVAAVVAPTLPLLEWDSVERFAGRASTL